MYKELSNFLPRDVFVTIHPLMITIYKIFWGFFNFNGRGTATTGSSHNDCYAWWVMKEYGVQSSWQKLLIYFHKINFDYVWAVSTMLDNDT